MGTDPLDDFGAPQTLAEIMRALAPAHEVTPETLKEVMQIKSFALTPVLSVREIDALGGNLGPPPKRSKKAKGAGGSEAERIVEAWLELNGWTAHRAAAAGLTKTEGGGFFVKSHDLFGCFDFIAFKVGGVIETWAIQVTTQSGRSERRKKIEAREWPTSWNVSIVSHEPTQDPARRNRRLHFLKFESRDHDQWKEPIAVQFDMHAIDAHRSAKAQAKKAAREEKEQKKAERKAARQRKKDGG